MQELPDFDKGAFDKGSQGHRGQSRPGLEPIPVFDAAQSVNLDLEILRETYDQILEVIVDNEWEREEGLRTVLLAGLGYLSAQQRLEGVNDAASAGYSELSREQINNIIRDLASYHQQYSVMKFKAFKLYKVNQVLEMNISGLRATERMWEGWAERMRRQHSELQTEVIRLRALMSEFKLDWDVPLSKEVEAGLMVEEPETQALPELPPDPATNAFQEDFERPSFWEKVRRLFGGR